MPPHHGLLRGMPPDRMDEVCRTLRRRDQPQDTHHPPNDFLHVAIFVDGLPGLDGEAIRRAMEGGLAIATSHKISFAAP